MKKIIKDKHIHIKIDEPTKERLQLRAADLNKTLSVYMIECAKAEIARSEAKSK